jgi:hypothetical protein
MLALVCSPPLVGGQQPTADAPPANYRFTAEAGLLVFHVHREHAADFEAVMRRVTEGLPTLATPLRREQAAGWRLFRARETATAAIYVVLVDPAVRDADYDPVKMITELASAEAADLYERLRAAVIRVERLELEQIR